MSHSKRASLAKKQKATFSPLFFCIVGLCIAATSIIVWSIPVPIVFAVADAPKVRSIKPATTTAPVAMPAAIKKTPEIKPEAHLEIPKIGVNAAIKNMGLTPAGAMAVPGNRVDVGLFSPGTRPGDVGSAVIGGHNRWASGPGAFANLNQLEKGDIVSVVDAKGVTTSFVVRDIRTYDAMDADTSAIFQSDSGTHLNLITCSGEWDPSTKSYTTRLVLFTDIVPASGAIAAR